MKQLSRIARPAGIAAALVASLALAVSAHADPLKCKQEIAKDTAKYVQAASKALQKCHEAVVKGKILPQDCHLEPTAAAKIAKADSKLRSGVNKQCGGADKACNTAGDNDSLASIGWPSICPNFEGGSCNNAISTCGDINDCLICIAAAAVDQSMSLSYDSLTPSTSGSDLNKCQVAIGKNATKFLNAKNKALAKCEKGVMKGTVIGPCPDAGGAQPAIAKAESKKIAGICKACGGDDKTCDGNNDTAPGTIGFPASCPGVTIPGGTACGTIDVSTLQGLVDCVDCVNEFKDDCLDPLAVPALRSYPAECNHNPNVPPCAVTPANTATPCPTATPGIVCPSQVITDANGAAIDLDTGWTGQSHDGHAPTNNRLTLSVSGCSNPDSSTCGVCNTSGPLANSGGAAFNTHRCVTDTRFACAVDGDCTGLHCSGGPNSGAVCTASSECPSGSCAAGPGGVCSFYFGGPLPLSAGGVSVCITNQVTGPITGTVDIEAGTTASTINLTSRVHVGPTLDKPCPNCLAGTFCVGGTNNGALCASGSACPGGSCGAAGECNSGPHAGEFCIANGHSDLFGDVGFDCPPSPLADVGHLAIVLPYSTGTQSIALSAASPNCRAPGFNAPECFGGSNVNAPCTLDSECPGGACQTPRCFCDTCNNTAATSCTSNADCVAVGATVCGGRRCLGGPNVGTPCNLNSECPGGGCGVPGAQSAFNQCDDNVCSPTSTCVGGCNNFQNCDGAFHCVGGANIDALCTVDSECPGGSCDAECPGGSCVSGNEGTCAGGPFESFCTIETFRGCGTNSDCVRPGDTCTFGKFRDCFLDNGVIGGTVTATGIPYPSCGGVGSGAVGALFCIPPTSSGSVNSVSGLPGLGRVVLPYTATFIP